MSPSFQVFGLAPKGTRRGCVGLTVLARQIAYAAKLVGPDRVCRTLRACAEVLECGDADALESAAARISWDCDR
ncbi:MAG: hypothetical protein NVV74_21575 [Magnetospirillum sp.]|nr:hypothetical protein [Magnetospirillum sp.]